MPDILAPDLQARMAIYWLGIVQYWLRADGTLGGRTAAFAPAVPWCCEFTAEVH